jgi:hypothetical protein
MTRQVLGYRAVYIEEMLELIEQQLVSHLQIKCFG